jgi:hypothetical protein
MNGIGGDAPIIQPVSPPVSGLFPSPINAISGPDVDKQQINLMLFSPRGKQSVLYFSLLMIRVV